MELKDLVGEHLLDAVDFSDEQVKTWGDEYEACQVMRFRLDGKCYIATEDPSDGYRVTGQTVIEVGTCSVDDYYPGFVASFHPEAMAHNVEIPGP